MTGKSLLAFIFSFILLAVSVNAQSNNLTGRIDDSENLPIAGATVVLRNKRTGLERVAATDKEGRFTFTGLSDDEFELIAFAKGFGRNAVVVTERGEEVVLILSPEAISEQVTVVSGSRQEELRESLNTKVDVLTADDIKNTGYETVGEALREVPGVITRRNSETAGAAGEQVQGLDSRQVLVLMDGQPLVGARGIKSGVINLDRQSTARLDSVEVVKGASSALYGSDAIGGVINLRTKEPTSPLSIDLTAAGGNFGVFDGRGQVGFVKDKLSGIFSLERHKNNGFDLSPNTFTTDGSGYHRWDGYGKLIYKFNNSFSMTGFANSYWNDAIGQVQGEPSAQNPSGLQVSNIKDEAQNYGLNADWAIDGKSNLQLRGYFSRFDEYNFSRSFPTNAPLPDGNLFERYGKFDATYSRVIGERQFLQVGAEFATNRYSGINRLQNDKGKADTKVVWFQDKINVIDRLTLTLGARYDHHSIFGNAISPKVGLNFRVNDNASLRASWGRGFRAPDLGQLFYRFGNSLFGYQVIGNSRLSPEHSGSWQVGGDFNALSRRLRFGVNFFRNDVRNLINSRNIGFVTMGNVDALIAANGLDPAIKDFISYNQLLFVYQNTANAHTQGVELEAQYALPYGFSVSGAYTFLEAIDESPTIANPFLTGRHKHHGFSKISYVNPEHGISANFRGTFFGKWYSSATNLAPAFQLWDIYGSKNVWKGFEIYGSIDNLFDSQDPNAGLAQQVRVDAGRTFRIGMNWRFDRKD